MGGKHLQIPPTRLSTDHLDRAWLRTEATYTKAALIICSPSSTLQDEPFSHRYHVNQHWQQRSPSRRRSRTTPWRRLLFEFDNILILPLQCAWRLFLTFVPASCLFSQFGRLFFCAIGAPAPRATRITIEGFAKHGRCATKACRAPVWWSGVCQEHDRLVVGCRLPRTEVARESSGWFDACEI